uniref:Alpha-tubulin N-acetyltransferase n=1 Tax=Ciona savignyi TaxID=51511 RepID=H2ZDE8_CIOSA
MEFDFNINHIFPDEVTLIGEKSPFRNKTNSRLLERNLQIVIDTLGKRSAKAQQLTGSITTFLKSQLNNHRLFILKDDCANNGLGCVIGFLKVGKKRLFVLDRDGNHNEMNPLCVLDFYVHESQQRKGCGLCLFKHMLSMEATKASHLAIDRPSHKFISFLKKHFNLWATIPQVNNFVIFDGFFKNRSDMVRNSSSGSDKISQFRPLSRAVSDGIIKRNRQSDHTVMSTALKD